MDRTREPAFEIKVQRKGQKSCEILKVPPSGELFELARMEDDEDTLHSVAADVAGIEKRLAELEFRRMFANPMDPSPCFI